tara:strand:- start:557 stop:886 length:330 start_codon:yes stop_codon:yes gene_type:complete
VIGLTPKQQERLGKLLSMGIPLPLAFPLAMDPRGASIAAEQVNKDVNLVLDKVGAADIPKVVKRKTSAYSKKYSREFKKIAPKFKNKNGKWKTGGFKKAVKAAHKAVKK